MKRLKLIVLLLLLLPIIIQANLYQLKLMGGVKLFKDEFKMESMNEKLKSCFGLGIGKGSKKSRFEANFLFASDFKKLNTHKGWYYYRLYDFSLPLLYKYKFINWSSPYIVAGASASIILADRTDIYGKPWKDTKNRTYFDYGLILGTGFEFDLKKTSLTIEGRYYHGLPSLDFWGYSFKRRGFHVLLGLLFW